MVGGGGSAPKLAFTSLGLTPQTPKLATLTVTIMHARSQGVVDAPGCSDRTSKELGGWLRLCSCSWRGCRCSASQRGSQSGS